MQPVAKNPLSSAWGAIKSRSRSCAQTQAPFGDGEKVVSILFQMDSGAIDRLDLSESVAEGYNAPGTVLGKWVRIFKNNTGEDKIQEAVARQSAEGLFLSLVEKELSELSLEQALLKQLLALWLERKRLLKPVGKRTSEGQTYRHAPSNQEIHVPWTEPSAEQLVAIQSAIEALVLRSPASKTV